MGADTNGKHVISLTGRIDSNNAAAIEKQVFTEIEGNTDEIVIDAAELEYISSAGLRVLMKLRKSIGKKSQIVNVSRDVYDILEVTGFTELFDVRKAYRQISVDGLEVIGKGFYGTVYRIDSDSIVKVYNGADKLPKIENEIEKARKAFLCGIPTAIAYDIVKVGENYGSVFELLNARTFNELIQNNEVPFDEVIERFVALLKIIHTTKTEKGVFPSYKKKFMDYLEAVAKHLSTEQYEGLKKLLTSMDEEDTVVHGDTQLKNVMMVSDEPMLIDMDTLGVGNPVFDLAGLYVTYLSFNEDDPDNAMDFVGMSTEMVHKILYSILDRYFEFKDEEHRREIMDRIALAATIRFLYILETSGLKSGVLGKKRIERSREHIDELLKTVTTLAV